MSRDDSNPVLMHDAPVRSFSTVSQDGITVDDDGSANFSWDEIPVVKVDAPSDLEGAFDTDRFFKIEGATIARPIKQDYHVGNDTETYKKPAEELRLAAWSFDNAPFTLGHPDTGMVKDVDDVHGFWKNPRYLSDEDRLVEDLYIPETDAEAREFVANNQDVSVGFFNRVYRDYDGETGDLTDEDGVDGYQVDIYGNHVAGVERGRCPSEKGCGLDSTHGRAVLSTSHETHDGTTSFLTENSQKQQEGESDVRRENGDYQIAPLTEDYEENGTWYAIAPDENPDGEPKYPIENCSDVQDAWKLRGHGDYTIEQSTLESRIQERARQLDCDVPGTEESEDSDCDCTTDNDTQPMGDNDFDIPELSVDALAEQNDQVKQLKEQKDEYEEGVEELRDELGLDDDECPCDVVPDIKAERDEIVEILDDVREALDLDDDTDVAERVEDIADEWQEFRADQRDERLDELESLGADRDEWEDEPLEALDEEIERRKEVMEAVGDTSPTGVADNQDGGDDEETTYGGQRRFGRGHAAGPDQ